MLAHERVFQTSFCCTAPRLFVLTLTMSTKGDVKGHFMAKLTLGKGRGRVSGAVVLEVPKDEEPTIRDGTGSSLGASQSSADTCTPSSSAMLSETASSPPVSEMGQMSLDDVAAACEVPETQPAAPHELPDWVPDSMDTDGDEDISRELMSALQGVVGNSMPAEPEESADIVPDDPYSPPVDAPKRDLLMGEFVGRLFMVLEGQFPIRRHFLGRRI